LQADYLPAQLNYEDYPNLIEKRQRVDTIAVPAVLAAYNWAPNTDRYRRLAHFVDVFFGKISDFQKPPFHPKWKEVSLIASLSGWTRFKPAQDWLTQHKDATAVSDERGDFATFLAERGNGDLRASDRDALFQQFLEWQKRQGH
jgi:hypothetical protein